MEGSAQAPAGGGWTQAAMGTVISFPGSAPLPNTRRVLIRDMAARTRRARVTGIGGIFFRARNPKALVRWYRRHLGMDIEDSVALFTWRGGRRTIRTSISTKRSVTTTG